MWHDTWVHACVFHDAVTPVVCLGNERELV
jgi:hypothetical protein